MNQARDDGPALLGVILHGVWETVSGADRLAKREAVEARIKAILQTYVGTKGLLEIARQDDGTWAGTGSATLANARLESVDIEEAENNVCLQYSLRFSVPIQNGQIGRQLIFTGGGSKTINADIFLVLKSGEDRTVFKPVFRAGFVRIPDGPPLKITRVVAIRQALAGATDLIKRQLAETEFEAWAFTRIGTEGTLTIEGV